MKNWRFSAVAVLAAALLAGGAWWGWQHRGVGLRIAVDQTFRSRVGWRDRMDRRIVAVSEIYRRQTGVTWRVKEMVEWNAPISGGLDALRLDLRRSVGVGDADVLLGITGRGELGRRASVVPFADTIVVAQPPDGEDREFVLALAHELAHLFGVSHSAAAKGSLMDEASPSDTIDAGSARLIRDLRSLDLRGGPCGLSSAGEQLAIRTLSAAFHKSAKPEANAWHVLGTSCLSSAGAGQAIRLLQTAVKIDPDFSPARYDLAAALELDNQPDNALAQLRELVRRDERYPGAHAALAALLGHRNATDEALQHAARALQLDPDRPAVHLLMGSLLAVKPGGISAAIAEFHRAVELDPTSPEAHRAREQAIVRRDNALAQAAAYRRSAAAAPGNVDARFRLAVALTVAGDLKGARGELEKVIHLNPNHAQARNNLAVLHYASQDYIAAWREVRAALKLGYNPDPQFLAALRRISPE